MALRDQPYLPLYVQDYLTDEKLNECSPETQGIYVKIMCLMHKSKYYGKILLKQKYKQKDNISLNFANQLVKHLTFSLEEISEAIKELLHEEVCYLDGDFLCQKRMIKDNELSIKRAEAGKKGGKKSQENKDFAKANKQTNSEIENEDEIENENINLIETEEKTIEFLSKKFGFNEINHFKNYASIVRCVHFIFLQGEKEFKHFKDQIWNYFLYKDKSKEKIHSFNTFLGSLEEKYLNGGWNAENWIKKYSDEISKTEENKSYSELLKEEKQGKKYPSTKRKFEPDLMKTITQNYDKKDT